MTRQELIYLCKSEIKTYEDAATVVEIYELSDSTCLFKFGDICFVHNYEADSIREVPDFCVSRDNDNFIGYILAKYVYNIIATAIEYIPRV